MWRLIWRGTGSLITVLCGLIIVIRAQPYDDGGVRGMLAETQICPATCIMGLQPGYTTFDEAVAGLDANDWVLDVQIQYDSDIRQGALQWTWSGQQPAIINAQQPGTAQIRNGIISYVTLPTRAELWQFLLLIGPPDASHFLLMRSPTRHVLYHRARYAEGDLILLANTVACPLSPTALYQSGVVLEMFMDPGALIADQRDFHYGATHLLRRELTC